MIGVIKSSFEQHLKSFNLSASGELASNEESAYDDVSFFWTSCFQNTCLQKFKLPSVDSIALICSSIPVL